MKENNVSANLTVGSEDLSVTLKAMFDGMEGLLQSKTVIGDPIDMGSVKLIPLLEITAGLAGGSFSETAKQKGAAAMTAKISPVAMLMIEGSMVRLINIKNQDAISKLVDLIPDAVDKLTGNRIYAASVAKAEEIAKKIGVRLVNDNDIKGNDGISNDVPEETAE